MVMNSQSPNAASLGTWARAVLVNLSTLWDLDVVCLNAQSDIDLVFGAGETLAEQVEAWSLGPHLEKVAKDVFGSTFQTESDGAKRFLVGFSRSKLKPKRDHVQVAQACLDAVKCVLVTASLSKTAMEFTQRVLLSHNNPEKLMGIVLNHYVQRFEADYGVLAVNEPGIQAIRVVHGIQEDRRFAFQDLASHPAINAQIKTMTNHVFREGFPVDLGGGEEIKLGQLSVGVLTDMNRPVGHMLLGYDQAMTAMGDYERQLERACREIISLYGMSRLHEAREHQFFQVSEELAQFKETRDVEEMDFRDLEYRWQELMGAHRRLTQIFRIIERLRDCPKDMTYMTHLLEYLKALCGAATATLCFVRDHGLYLIYSHHERPVQTMFFSELDGGIYHDMVDRDSPVFWDGEQQRPFFLPSGHPRVRNCACLPLRLDGQVVGSAMVANQVDRELMPADIPGLEKLISFLSPDVWQAFDASGDAFS